jgi:energy-converting hydrogenase Eha subunit H
VDEAGDNLLEAAYFPPLTLTAVVLHISICLMIINLVLIAFCVAHIITKKHIQRNKHTCKIKFYAKIWNTTLERRNRAMLQAVILLTS